MTNSSLMLTFLYVAVAVLLLVLCLATAWKRWIKIAMIVVVTVTYFFANHTFEEMLGWPTPRTLPEKFAIVSAVIEEPNKERGVDGAIYLWVTPYEEIRLVRANNTAAAVTLSGAVLGFAMPIANVIAHSDTLYDLAVWGVIAGLVQLAAWIVARVALPTLKEDIAANRVAPAVMVAALSLTVGLINAACMTY